MRYGFVLVLQINISFVEFFLIFEVDMGILKYVVLNM